MENSNFFSTDKNIPQTIPFNSRKKANSTEKVYLIRLEQSSNTNSSAQFFTLTQLNIKNHTAHYRSYYSKTISIRSTSIPPMPANRKKSAAQSNYSTQLTSTKQTLAYFIHDYRSLKIVQYNCAYGRATNTIEWILLLYISILLYMSE